jgi:hypothetical protein
LLDIGLFVRIVERLIALAKRASSANGSVNALPLIKIKVNLQN